MIDDTHSPGRRSWVASANQHADFPIQNLPLGVFTPRGASARGGVAIGDDIFDLATALELGLFDGPAAEAARAASGATLNPLFALGRDARLALRRRVGEILDADSPDHARYEALSSRLIHRAEACRIELPATIGDYTDFFAGIHHATNAGKLFRPDNPLLPNYKYVPIGYHGRASSIRPSGAEVRRPNGQRKPAADPVPSFGPSRNLDYELELGLWIGPGNALGAPIPVAEAASHIAGFCLLNDWSARDIQGWEYQPLGPFLGKSFLTTISPWVVTPRRWRRSERRKRRGPPATRLRYPIFSTRRIRKPAPSTSISKFYCLRMACGPSSFRRTGCLPATHAISIGPSPSWSPITPAAAAICGRATSLGPARSRRRKTMASVACWRFPREAGSRLRWRRAKVAVSWRTATP